MRLAVGIITWQDGQHMLEQTIASLEGIQDELLIADGAIDGIDLQGFAGVSDLAWLEKYDGLLPALEGPVVSSHLWESQSQKRTWLLAKARQLNCEWLLQIDADERLHGAALLKAWLPSWRYDAFPLPFLVEPGTLLCATWKCLRARAWPRVVAGGAYIEHADGQVYCVVPPDGRPPVEAKGFLPWISHHPDERPAGRRLIRLGELEETLEPPPADALEWISPGLSPAPLLASPSVDEQAPTPGALQAVEQWFCDQCGRMYGGPGLCDVEHPANAVIPVENPAPLAEKLPEPPVPPSSPDEPAVSGDQPPAVPAEDVVPVDVPLVAESTPQPALTDQPADVPADAVAVEPVPAEAAPPDAAPPADVVAETPSLAVQAGPVIAAGHAALDELARLLQDA